MPLKTPFKRLRRIRGGDVHIKAPIIDGITITLCGLPAAEGTTPIATTSAPVDCATCRTIAAYCQSHRALRKPAKVKP